MKTIVLISCVSKKKETNGVLIPAKDLYISTLFRKALVYAESLSPDYIYILSAEHHLLPLDKKVKKYDKTLNKMSVEECKQWAQKVLTELKAKGHDLVNDEFTLLAGDKYCKYILGENGIKKGHQVYKENNLKGIGYILRFLTQTNDNNCI
ncbi:MAG: hypothetical protein E7091_09605 [Bacteroidales bacterium]|nr:hypothetical protein [Bacteroidales bacterium]